MKNVVVTSVEEAVKLYESIYTIVAKYCPFSFSMRGLSNPDSKEETVFFDVTLESTFISEESINSCRKDLQEAGFHCTYSVVNSLKTNTSKTEKCNAIQSRGMLEIQVSLEGISLKDVMCEYGVLDIFE